MPGTSCRTWREEAAGELDGEGWGGAEAESLSPGLRCFTCSSLHKEETCQQTLRCPLSQPFCKAILSQWDTGEWPRAPQGTQPSEGLRPEPLQHESPFFCPRSQDRSL